ncbi:hypothetical protein GCM10028792_31100 [Salinisphaera aquimarina]
MPEAAANIAIRQRLDLQDHRGRQITSQILREHELVLVMEEGQKNWLADRFPESRGRVFLVSHWDDKKDVPDPFRHSEEFFEEVFVALAEYVSDWAAKLAPRSPSRTAVR